MIVRPGATIGILGGGQLGRMLAIAAAQLGYRSHVFAPEDSGPATEVSAAWTAAGYDDSAALAAFAAAVDVVTYEFENVPPVALDRLEALVPIRPGRRSLEVAGSRPLEKGLVRQLGGQTAPFRPVTSLAELTAALAEIGTPAILKTASLGYDGKGQVRLQDGADPAAAWAAVGGAPSVLEGFVRFAAEFSVILCRAADGTSVAWDVPANVHEQGILATSTVPAPDFVLAQADAAIALARTVADELQHIGVLTLEFFATDSGPVFNEMAPRVHNSGHWTIEGAVTSQFENHVRAVCGLPLGSTARTGATARMTNLIGAEAERWAEILADPAAKLHLYGKTVRPGRKMGHVTRIG